MSTVGLVPGIDKLTAEGIPVTLALSLHAPDDELRNELVPINTRWSVDEALDAAHRYFEATGRRVSIEYALIRDINDQGWRADLLGEKLNRARPRLGARQPDPAQPDARLEVDGVPARRRAELRRAAAGPRHPDDDPRHPRPGHRRRLRPARRVDRLTRVRWRRRLGRARSCSVMARSRRAGHGSGPPGGTRMVQLSVGVMARSLKENEHRLPLHPRHVDRIPELLRPGIFLEHGYGERFGVADDQLERYVGGFRSREELVAECDVILAAQTAAQRHRRAAGRAGALGLAALRAGRAS